MGDITRWPMSRGAIRPDSHGLGSDCAASVIGYNGQGQLSVDVTILMVIQDALHLTSGNGENVTTAHANDECPK